MTGHGVPREKVFGSYCIHDLGFAKDDIQWWIDKYLLLSETNTSATFENVLTTPSSGLLFFQFIFILNSFKQKLG